MNKAKHLALYIPLIILVVIYGGHAVGGLLGSEEFYRLIAVLGFSDSMTRLLVFAIFPLDGLVALLLIFGGKLSRNFPWDWLFLWAGLWPWVPRVLELMGGYELEWGDAVAASVLAALAYYLWHHHNICFLKRKEMKEVLVSPHQ